MNKEDEACYGDCKTARIPVVVDNVSQCVFEQQPLQHPTFENISGYCSKPHLEISQSIQPQSCIVEHFVNVSSTPSVNLVDNEVLSNSISLDKNLNELPLEHEVKETDLTPHVGMEFDTEEHAYRIYNAYAGFIGFSIRKDWVNKSKMDHTTIISRRFVCFKEGFKKIRNCETKRVRKDIRTGCLAQMVISRQENEKFIVTCFEKNHNHVLATPRSRHKLPSQRRISNAQATQIELAKDSGIRQKLIFEFLSRQVGGRENVGCTFKDISNHLTSKRMREMKEGEAYTLLHYFQSRQSENPSFFYEIQLDAEDQITNIFWADAKMVVDYSCFGDVVYFDTTYRTNKSGRPFAPFLGFNHHRETVIFGAALLYDETAESFEWLFKTFLKAMCEKKPKTIFTDQDAAMAKAILIVLPESYHRLCTWHLYQNALKNVSHAFKRSSSFASEFKSCMYDYEYEDDFLHAWETLLDKHDLRQNKWMQDFFKRREKWASVYGRNTFSAGSTSTQLSESFNSRLKDYVGSTSNVLEFFKNFERMLDNMRYKEIDSNYDMTQKMTPLHLDILLLKSARDIYTSTIYALVLKEYEKSCNMLLEECNQVSTLFEYKVRMVEHMREHTVSFNSKDETVECSCKLFEFIGILCGHALRVLNHWNKVIIPPKYILKRWTKHARSGCVLDNNGRVIKEDPKLVVSNRFKDLCRTAVEIASKAAETDDATTFFAKKLLELGIEVDKILMKNSSAQNQQGIASDKMIPNDSNKHLEYKDETSTFEKNTPLHVKGMKKKDGVSSRVKGRPKSCLEKKPKKKHSQTSTSNQKEG